MPRRRTPLSNSIRNSVIADRCDLMALSSCGQWDPLGLASRYFQAAQSGEDHQSDGGQEVDAAGPVSTHPAEGQSRSTHE